VRPTVLAVLCGMALAAGSAEAQTPSPAGAPPAAKEAAALQKGGDLFAAFGCGSCHSLAAAGATGHVGPAFDGNAALDQAFIVDRVSNGAGPMPSFAGPMSPEEIAALAAYILQARVK
jgi:mono/diheme cytochrome c family protein